MTHFAEFGLRPALQERRDRAKAAADVSSNATKSSGFASHSAYRIVRMTVSPISINILRSDLPAA